MCVCVCVCVYIYKYTYIYIAILLQYRRGAPGLRGAGRVSGRTKGDMMKRQSRIAILHVEHAERITKYGIRFIFRPFYEYSNLEYVHVPV